MSHRRNICINVTANVAFVGDAIFLTVWLLKDSPLPGFFMDAVKVEQPLSPGASALGKGAGF